MADAAAVGHRPFPPAWMWMACAAPSTSLSVVTETVAMLPLSRRTALPSPLTRLVGTGTSLPERRSPTGAALAFAVAGVSDFDDEPEPRSRTAAMPATISAAAPTSGQR